MEDVLWLALVVTLAAAAAAETYPGDVAVLRDLRKSLMNGEILGWPTNVSDAAADPCGPPAWRHVSCSRAGRVENMDLKEAGLVGELPGSFANLTGLVELSLQNNHFTGPLPSFRGMSSLQRVYLNGNGFDSIPADFFVGLTDLIEISLDGNPLNASSGGWALPANMASSPQQLQSLMLDNCSLVGGIPEFLGMMNSLQKLTLAYNRLSGPIPSTFNGSSIQVLWLNNQLGDEKLSGTLDWLPTMTSLQDAWLHGNQFSGPIPDGIGACKQLQRLWLNDNQLVGLVPSSLADLTDLDSVTLDNNLLMGPILELKQPKNYTYSGNKFCAQNPGDACSPEVMALLDFLRLMGYPDRLANSWSGNNPCASWLGITCFVGNVTMVNLPGFRLNGSICPSLGALGALRDIRLARNNLTGLVPDSLTQLKKLETLDLSMNNLDPPLPKFDLRVKVNVNGNPYLNGKPKPPPGTPPGNAPQPPSPGTPGGVRRAEGKEKKSSLALVVAIPVAVGVVLMSLAAVVFFFRRRKKGAVPAASIVVHPRDNSDPDSMVKVVVANNDANGSAFYGNTHSGSSRASDVHMIEAGNFVIAVQVLRSATKNFTQENVLGRGGFGVVYKGELHDGTMIAVKRMEAAVISNKALDEFQAEIAVLTKVRHRNLVSILGYSIEGNERLLVYEYMSNGALSKHLFQWKQLGLEPLSWKKRLNIALDVARGMEYLHNLGHHCFIHRDLKSANILLGDDFRAKVSDFGLVKHAPDGNFSVATRLAGTFGYLAPEYAVTGKITTKADVFSFGVVLMELITGMTALDESRLDEESRYLASWFCQIRKDEEKLKAAIDPALGVTDETFESISVIAELAGHCTAREPHQRPDMGHAVNVLVPMVEKWKPVNDETEDYMGIDLHQPLLQMVKGWQDAEGSITDGSILSLEDSKGSIPARPAGFAESFTSADGR